MIDIMAGVERFNRLVLGLPVPGEPTRLGEARKNWAAQAFLEEVTEFVDATTLEEEVDAVADLVYFAMGRFQEMGVDAGKVFEEIQRANMQKQRGEVSRRPNSLGYDAVKPEGWRPPVHVLSPFRRKKLVVIGHGRHGKDTVCEMLRENYGYSFTSSSRFCAETVVFPAMKDTFYRDAEACYADRANHRAAWFDLIADYLKNDQARLGRAILSENDVYCGIRNPAELEACRPLADVVVWVEARRRVPCEHPSSMQLEAYMADVVIDNNAGVAELAENVKRAVSKGFL